MLNLKFCLEMGQLNRKALMMINKCNHGFALVLTYEMKKCGRQIFSVTFLAMQRVRRPSLA